MSYSNFVHRGRTLCSGYDLSLQQFTASQPRPSSPAAMISLISQAYALQMYTRRYRIGIVVAILPLVSFTLYQFSFAPSSSNATQYEKPFTSHADTSLTQPPMPLDSTLPLPSEYQQTPHELEFCAERFGLPYLEGLSNTSATTPMANPSLA